MKRFIKRILVFLVILILFFGIIITFIFVKINEGHNFKIDKNFDKLILGHSHSEGALNDSLIEGVKNLSSGGEFYFYTFLKVKKIVKENRQIKTVFLEFTNNQIALDMEAWAVSEEYNLNNLPKYTPVMNFANYKYIVSKDPKSFLKASTVTFKNNLKFVLKNKRNFIIHGRWGGFLPSKECFTDSLLNSQQMQKKSAITNEKTTSVNLNFVIKIIEFCNNNGVKVCLIRSPQHKEYLGRRNEKQFQEIINSKFSDVLFFDFNDFSLSNDDYRDLEHLNYKGAKKFSLFFDSLLKKGLIQSSNPEQMVQDEILKQNSIK